MFIKLKSYYPINLISTDQILFIDLTHTAPLIIAHGLSDSSNRILESFVVS